MRAVLVQPGDHPDETSDQVLDGPLAVRRLLSTKDGGSVFARWRDHPAARGGWRQEVWGERDERLVDDLRSIDFGALSTAVDRLSALASAADELHDGADGLRARLADTWGGRGADLAAGRFDDFARRARGWQDTLVRLAAAVDAARDTIKSGLAEWAGQADTVRGITVDDLSTRLTQLDRLDIAVRANPVGLLRTPGAHFLNVPGETAWPTADVIEYLDGYCTHYEAAVARFRRDVTAVHKATADTWELFLQVLRTPSTVDSATAPAAARNVAVSASPTSVTVNADGERYVIDGVHPAPTQSTGQPAAQGAPSGVPASHGGAGRGGPVGHGGAAGVGADSGAAQSPGPGAATGAEAPPPVERQPPATAPAAATQQPPQSGTGGGMGMGGMGGGGGRGGDTERKPSQWRLVGSLFDAEDPAAGFDGIVGEDPANRTRR